ncbi:hypothetical protein EV182_001098 [Spiromyces aspiralis]|uniref:Uncharacterized protein n=1 Tax=Spiromyces aspiralis TaxID=68401 RepID=A0ACC1HHL5_9FUNG|nr:hypothetical protein EV182_001098 [Spiromyces aspiralis]
MTADDNREVEMSGVNLRNSQHASAASTFQKLATRSIKSPVSIKASAVVPKSTLRSSLRKTRSVGEGDAGAGGVEAREIPGGFPESGSDGPKTDYNLPTSSITTRSRRSRLKQVAFANELEDDENDGDTSEGDVSGSEKESSVMTTPKPGRLGDRLRTIDAGKTPRYKR